MSRIFFFAFLLFHALTIPSFAQDPPEGDPPAKRLPLKVLQAWENAERRVQKNREIYDTANAKALELFQKEVEKIKPPLNVEEVVRQFQQEAIVALDAKAKPPAPPPPQKGVAVFNGHRYRLVEECLSYEDAKKQCEEWGGNLLVIDDRNEQEFIQKAIKDYIAQTPAFPDDYAFWLGITRNQKKTWVSVTGKEQKYFRWYAVEPRDWYAHARIYPDGLWHSNEPKASKIFFICEWDK